MDLSDIIFRLDPTVVSLLAVAGGLMAIAARSIVRSRHEKRMNARHREQDRLRDL